MQVRRKLEAGSMVTGIWIMTATPAFAELARLLALDFVVIDLEHGNHTLDSMVDTLRCVQGGETAAIVRVPNHDPTLVSRVLDRGADGVMIPRVDDRETAIAMAAAARFPPHGTRGLAIGALRASGYGNDPDYRARSDREVMVMVQIESRKALDNALEIATVPGVDMAFIGPADLAADLGMEGPDSQRAYRKLVDDSIRTLRDAGIKVGTVPYAGHDAGSMAALGVRLLVNGSDIGIMNAGLKDYITRMARERSGRLHP